MTKVSRNISLDYEVNEAAKQHIPNFSGWINDTLKTFLIDAKPELKAVFDLTLHAAKLREEVKLLDQELAKKKAEQDKTRRSI